MGGGYHTYIIYIYTYVYIYIYIERDMFGSEGFEFWVLGSRFRVVLRLHHASRMCHSANELGSPTAPNALSARNLEP